jgi:cell division protein FtsL
MLNMFPMNVKQITYLKKPNFISIHVLMKLLVKDFFIGTMNTFQLILLILLKDVSIIINIDLKKYKLIMEQNSLIIEKK